MSHLIVDNVKGLFSTFLTKLSVKHNLDRKKLESILRNVTITTVPEEKETPKKEKKIDPLFEQAKEFIVGEMPSMKMTVDKLKSMCKQKGIKMSGKKQELIDRLNNPSEPKANRGGGKKKKKAINTSLPIIKKLTSKISSLAIRKNDQGYYVHLDTNFVFDPVTSKVVGKWIDGHLRHLIKEDVYKCIDLGISYTVPENLDYGIDKVVDAKLTEELGDDDFKEDYNSEDEEDGDDGGEN